MVVAGWGAHRDGVLVVAGQGAHSHGGSWLGSTQGWCIGGRSVLTISTVVDLCGRGTMWV